MFKLIVVVILTKQLEFVHTKDVDEDAITRTTRIDEIFKSEQFPLVSNLSVNAYEEVNSECQLIRLNVTWNEIDDQFNITNLQIVSTETSGRCVQSLDELNYPLQHRFIVKPSLNMLCPAQDIQPGCSYEISLQSDEVHDRTSSIIYSVPECVGNICDCTTHRPKPTILEVEPETDDQFKVTWDPGTSVSNKAYHITDVYFTCRGNNSVGHFWLVQTLNSNETVPQNYSRIKIHKIPEGDDYILSADFRNNYSCRTDTWIKFSVHENNTSHFLLLFIVGGVLLVLVVEHRQLIKYGGKVANKLRTRYNPARDGIPLSNFGNGPPVIPMQTNVQYMPAEFLTGEFDIYEFPSNKISIRDEIGSGAFGKVYSAKAFGIDGSETYSMVAVKTTAESSSKEEMDDFMAEINIFKKIGVHQNVVRLLGCCTLEKPYMMIMEFVPCGDLKNYLLELRDQWCRRRNNQRFFPDTSDGAYIVPEVSTSPISITSSRLPSTTETLYTNFGESQSPLLSEYSRTLKKALDPTELQNFALQIARGMAHLERIPITHRDLAARNILVNEFKVLKISDFGLSRRGPYVNHSRRKLPLRWMALEAITDHKYDNKSDVWSFGVVLWEIATLGAFPYEKVPDSFIVNYLQMGRRLERPEICTDEMYLLMLQCWAEKPEERPSFEELAGLLDVDKRKVYVDFSQLNPTYVFPPSELRLAGYPVAESPRQ